ncbi:MAG: tetratricopeptide repeat protein [Armatimonadota bacterium]
MRKRSVGSSLLATVPLILLAATLAFWVITAMSLRVGGALSATASQEAVRRTADDIVTSLKEGRTEQADALFNGWVGIAGGSSNAYIALASEIIKAGRPMDAARYLTAATAKKEVNWDPMLWATLAEAQNKVSDTGQSKLSAAEAERRAEAFTKGEPKTPKAKVDTLDRINRLNQVAAYYSDIKKEPSRAVALLEEALRLDENVQTLNALGYTLADKGSTTAEFNRAIELTKKAVAKAPGNPIVLDSYGWALFKKNDLQGARRVLREAVDAAPMIAEIRYHLGVVYAQLGLTTDAAREFDRALVLDPENKGITEAKHRLRQPAGQGILEKA